MGIRGEQMKVRVLILIACISMIAVAAFAHGDEQHVIGTVASVSTDSITVKTTANALVTVAIIPQTTFSKNKAAAKLTDLKGRDRVLIHYTAPSDSKLAATHWHV